MKIVLASGSPHRKKILSSLKILFEVIESGIDEEVVKGRAKTPREMVMRLALRKAKAVMRILKKRGEKEFVIVAGDSSAVMRKGGRWHYFDKPKDRKQARRTLLALRGREHEFITGLVVIGSSGKIKKSFCSTKIYFRNFSEKTLKRVLDAGIWKGRAGGYDIEKNKGTLIEKYVGSKTNVAGLPVEALVPILKNFGIKNIKIPTKDD